MIDLADYYSGGYFLIRAETPDWYESLKNELGVETLLSLSNCICLHLEVYWGWNPGNREAALKFGIPEDKLDEFVEWCGTDYKTDLDITSMFYSVEAAQRFIERFLPDTSNLYLIGTGMHKSLEEANWREPAEWESIGIEKQIEQHLTLTKNGTVLGFEVVSFSYHDLTHSWLCSGLHKDMNDLFDIQTGQYGLLQTREDAQQVYEWIAEDKQEGRRAEPELYDYWLLVSYPLSAEG